MFKLLRRGLEIKIQRGTCCLAVKVFDLLIEHVILEIEEDRC